MNKLVLIDQQIFVGSRAVSLGFYRTKRETLNRDAVIYRILPNIFLLIHGSLLNEMVESIFQLDAPENSQLIKSISLFSKLT